MAHFQVQVLPPYDQSSVALMLSAGVVAMTNGSDPEAGSGSQWCSITLIPNLSLAHVRRDGSDKMGAAVDKAGEERLLQTGTSTEVH